MPITTDVYKKIVDAKVFIDEHFDSPLDLDSIAGEACLSRYHFHRLFRRIYKRTPKEQFYGTEVIMSDGVGNWYSVTQQKAH